MKPGQDGADVLVANYHAPAEAEIEKSVETLDRLGVKNIVLQREVFDPELYFGLLTVAPIGELNRMTQYKSAEQEDQTAHLLTYPVLMCHDVAGYGGVLVGHDQTQHLQFARHLIKKYNRRFQQDLRVPDEKIVVGRIKDLKRSENKMSKSSPQGCLFLDDEPDVMAKKIRKATMDEAGTESLRFLYTEFVSQQVPESNRQLKEELSAAMVEKFRK